MGHVRQVYCGICGGPMFDGGWRDRSDDSDGSDDFDKPIRWLSDGVVLTTAHKVADGIELDEYYPGIGYPYTLGPRIPSEADRSVIRVKVNTDFEGTQFKLQMTDQHVTPFYVDIPARPGGYSRGGPLYIIIHQECLNVADRYINSVDTVGRGFGEAGDRITSVKQLWEVLYRRVPEEKGGPSTRILPEPFEYFGGGPCRNCYWEPRDDPLHGEIHESNPINMRDLTTSILENLKPMQPGHKFQISPPEPSPDLTHHFQNLSLDCEYIKPPFWWYTALLNKALFPWLWDLDIDIVRAKLAERDNWDWELLVRQLSQVEIHEPGNEVMGLSLGLKNRRRIWRILDEARVGDISEPAEARMRARHEEKDRRRELWVAARDRGITYEEFSLMNLETS